MATRFGKSNNDDNKVRAKSPLKNKTNLFLAKVNHLRYCTHMIIILPNDQDKHVSIDR